MKEKPIKNNKLKSEQNLKNNPMKNEKPSRK